MLRCLCLFAFCAGLSLLAQEVRATVTGTVTDPQGAVVVGARITARNLGTGAIAEVTTNETGLYVAPFLPIGRYQLTVAMAGFKGAVVDALELRVGDRVQLNFTLEVGAAAETITVSGETVLLDTATSSNGQVIDSAKVKDLPLLGRNPFLLAAVSSGVQYSPTRGSRSNRPFDNGGMDSFSINGGRQTTNEFLLDGVPDTNTETTSPSNLSFVPSPDATEEFKVQTNTYDAQYGRTGGGVVNVSLKAGTNDLHSVLYYYLRNDKLNANAYETNAAGLPRSPFRWSQPGLVVNGPVVIPKLYNGKDRTFFMFSWEKIKSAIPLPQNQTVPTNEQRAGDFSRTVQANGQPILIYDPLTTAANGANYSRQPFAGNRIPSARFDPVAANLLKYIPLSNQIGNAQGFFNMISSPNPVSDEYDQFAIRIDQQITSKHRFFSRYIRGNRHETNSFAGFEKPASPWYQHWRINQGGNIDITSTLGPTLVSSFRMGYIRHQFAIQQYAEGFDPSTLGFPASAVGSLPRKFFPRIDYTDYTAFGPQRSTGSEFTFSDTWSMAETLSKVYRSHSFKFGFEGRQMFNNQDRPTSSFARFNFRRNFTQADPLRADAASGNAFASLLLGVAESGESVRQPALAYGNRYYVLFFQDDWKVNSRLTLNLGLRWDYETPQTERFNQQNRGFDTSSASPLQVPGLQLKGGLLFTDENNRLPFITDRNNFQHRIGAAYQVARSTVFRGGYGISYLPTFDTGFNNGFAVTTAMVTSTDGGLTPANYLRNPFPDGYQPVAGRSLGLGTLLGQGFSYGYNGREIPYVHQFSAGFQHELPGRVLVDLSYSGSRSRALQTLKGVNEISAEQFNLGSAALLEQVPNPLAGRLPGSAFNGATVPRQQLLRPFPQFAGITQDRHTIGWSNYNSLQLRVEKRMSRGVHMLLSYTFAKSIEAVNYLNPQDQFGQLASVLTSVDSPQRAVISGGWDLPFFKQGRGFTRQVLGGWQLSGIVTIQSGIPIGTPSGVFATGAEARLPDDQRSRARWFNTCTLALNGARQNCASATEPVAFTVQPPFTLRTLSTRFANIRDLRPMNVDLSIFKRFILTERLNLEFRAESFNMTNTPWFGAPNLTAGGAAFGTVAPSQANDPRNIQFALRLSF
ncbi:MAG TPA: TonB-dependent receptor [Bryobacteraceae bacterium]|nr:TonB-dependent receptor [Bryobacteraceae bacterium]